MAMTSSRGGAAPGPPGRRRGTAAADEETNGQGDAPPSQPPRSGMMDLPSRRGAGPRLMATGRHARPGRTRSRRGGRRSGCAATPPQGAARAPPRGDGAAWRGRVGSLPPPVPTASCDGRREGSAGLPRPRPGPHESTSRTLNGRGEPTNSAAAPIGRSPPGRRRRNSRIARSIPGAWSPPAAGPRGRSHCAARSGGRRR